jgi:hypothetical protein
MTIRTCVRAWAAGACLAFAVLLAGCGAPGAGAPAGGSDAAATAVKPPAVSKILIRYCDT